MWTLKDKWSLLHLGRLPAPDWALFRKIRICSCRKKNHNSTCGSVGNTMSVQEQSFCESSGGQRPTQGAFWKAQQPACSPASTAGSCWVSSAFPSFLLWLCPVPPVQSLAQRNRGTIGWNVIVKGLTMYLYRWTRQHHRICLTISTLSAEGTRTRREGT